MTRKAHNFIDLTGKVFNRLTVVKRVENNKQGRAMWLCRCECGKTSVVTTSSLLNGKTKSCGCYCKEMTKIKNKEMFTKHGMSFTHIYKAWRSMLDRCYLKKAFNYPNYGGRGITVCKIWKEDFTEFKNWAFSNGYQEGLTLDRIDVNGNYEPSNCRWVTQKEQARNRRNNKYITCNEETHCLSEWAELLGIKYPTLTTRFKKHGIKSIEKAIEDIKKAKKETC